jgi:transcriptional regulator with XRE-family HTH domain
MKLSNKEKDDRVPTVLRRMREAAKLTMRQAGAMIGISHVAVSQFENGKLDLPDYRIEQLLKAYGLDMSDLTKILGRPLVANPKDDCHSIIDRLDEEQLVAVSSILRQIVRISKNERVATVQAEAKQAAAAAASPACTDGSAA